MKSKILGLVLCALVLVLCGWLYSRQGVLRFASVNIENIDDPELVLAVKRKVAPFLGANLLTMSFSDIEKSLEQDPRIKKVFIGRKLPSTLNLKIIPRLPVASYVDGSNIFVVGDEGFLVEGYVLKEQLPVWIAFKKCQQVRKEKVAKFLTELRRDERESFDRVSQLEWVENHGLVLTVALASETQDHVRVDMGTDDFSERWRRVRSTLGLMSEQKIQGERIMALGDGQVVISGVKNLHNLKNELNLKEIVRRATPQSDTRVQAR